MLIVNNVTKKYGNFTALEDVSLEFKNGVFGLLAPNGAGKTTLIKMLTTLLFPTKGQILWNGTDIQRLGEEYRSNIGYLPQQFGYYKNNSPIQFLRYLSALKGINPKIADERIEQVLQMVSLEDVKNKKMRKFSGGMIQRVGIAQAMLNEPKILILDEPTAGLDPKERVRFRNIIHNLGQDRIVILSTHIVSDLETISGNIVMIKDHRLLWCESPGQICSRLNGKVFEVENTTKLSKGTLFLSERQVEDHTMLRFASDTPPNRAKPVLPNLEDVFLYVYRDEEEF